MESVKAADRAEMEKWQDFQQRFKISMGQFEAEMATMHGNVCTARPGRCRLCIFKTKIELLEKELKNWLMQWKWRDVLVIYDLRTFITNLIGYIRY